ncbi:hypothetical protein DEJ33_07160 [Curtobacterium sp. MCPF17_047]|nr:hypothetical protein DEJ24_04480 [Curtobacterium sp. MCPF17_001]PZF67029.1 hypothetical protein DEJ33_07160 [Curtobacterium sp. MCPF17_047]
MTPRTAAILGVTCGALLLTSCSTGGGEHRSEGTAKPSASASASATAQATTYNECVDGAAQVSVEKSSGPVTVSDCDGINIITSGQAYLLGSVKVLTVEASNATVEIGQAGVQEIAVLGSGNTITYTGDAPEITDEGDDNTVDAA